MRDQIIIELHRMMAFEEIAAQHEMSCEIIDQMNVVIKELQVLKDLVTNE